MRDKLGNAPSHWFEIVHRRLAHALVRNLIGDLLTEHAYGALSESDVTTEREFNFARGFLRNLATGTTTRISVVGFG
jgi:hypothetical protein